MFRVLLGVLMSGRFFSWCSILSGFHNNGKAIPPIRYGINWLPAITASPPGQVRRTTCRAKEITHQDSTSAGCGAKLHRQPCPPGVDL